MGGGVYSFNDRTARATTLGYHTKSSQETFSQRTIHNEMSPKDVMLREARDSDEHPNSLGIVIALDVTGSMGSVPAHLVRDGLPQIMNNIMQHGEKDPQLMFVGIGDHEYDRAPLQVGQFESSDDKLDHWLTSTYLEGGGGGNNGESYLLAWYFAGFRTTIDCFEKRNRKGFLFTIGDEPTLPRLPEHSIKGIMGTGQYKDYTAQELLEKASETYNVYHIHTRETYNGRSQGVVDGWKQLLGDNLLVVESHTEIPNVIAEIIGKDTERFNNDNDNDTNNVQLLNETETKVDNNNNEETTSNTSDEMML